MLKNDSYYMKLALKEAEAAYREGEMPVGAVIVCDGQVISRAHNEVEKLNDPTAHAEMIAITSAANYLASRHLEHCTLYVTLEPCAMCRGALKEARIRSVVFGAYDNNADGPEPVVGSVGGVLEQECEALIHDFFRKIRMQ